MRYLIILILLSFTISGFAQESRIDSLSKGDQKMLGIWKYDLPNQKVEKPSGKRFQSDEAGVNEEKQFWKKTESWICHLKEDKTFLKAWLENGILHEEEGTWSFDEATMALTLNFQNEASSYEITFKEQGQQWRPLNKEREDFNVLFVKRLGS